jgi:hypothetical protein
VRWEVRDLAAEESHFYQRFGFVTVEGSGFTPPETGRPHQTIVLGLQRASSAAAPSPDQSMYG